MRRETFARDWELCTRPIGGEPYGKLDSGNEECVKPQAETDETEKDDEDDAFVKKFMKDHDPLKK